MTTWSPLLFPMITEASLQCHPCQKCRLKQQESALRFCHGEAENHLLSLLLERIKAYSSSTLITPCRLDSKRAKITFHSCNQTRGEIARHFDLFRLQQQVRPGKDRWELVADQSGTLKHGRSPCGEGLDGASNGKLAFVKLGIPSNTRTGRDARLDSIQGRSASMSTRASELIQTSQVSGQLTYHPSHQQQHTVHLLSPSTTVAATKERSKQPTNQTRKGD